VIHDDRRPVHGAALRLRGGIRKGVAPLHAILVAVTRTPQRVCSG
jgi:hypothetical protein